MSGWRILVVLVHVDYCQVVILAAQQVFCIVDLDVNLLEEARELIDASIVINSLWSLVRKNAQLEDEAYLGRLLRALDPTKVPDIEPELVEVVH